MKRLLPALLFALLLPGYAAPALAQGTSRIVLGTHVGDDGWAFLHVKLPPGSYRVVSVEGWEPRPVNPKPLLLSFTPDPSLWKRLSTLAVAGPGEAYKPRVELVDTGSGVGLYAWAPGKPGAKVRIVLERLGGQGQAGGGKPSMVIIVPNETGLLKQAERIAELHRGQGLDVRIVTTDEIRTAYAPAEKPEGLCKPGSSGPDYDMDLALRIVSMLRDAEDEGVRYVLIIGGASDVPPLYYCSPILRELVNPEEAAVPTDYFYADPDYDGFAELAVGRIPISDPVKLSVYVSSLENWIRGGSWQEKALLAGGAPFATSIMVGEDAVIKALENLEGLGLDAETLLLSLGNYAGTRFTSYIGGYGLYYLVTHGAGSALLDYVPGGIWNYDFEEKLRSTEITFTKEPGVYLSPACRAGFWDYDLVDPPFKPPSIAVSLLEHGAAVAYLGFSRIAIEVIDGVTSIDGRTDASLAAADALLLLFMKSLGSAETLGDAWLSALNAYAVMPASGYRAYLTGGQEDIGELVLREAMFLGDPAAPNPWRGSAHAPSEPPELAPPPGSIDVGAAVLAMPLARYTSGTLPAFNPGGSETITLSFKGTCPDEVHAEALYRVDGYYMIGLEELPASLSRDGKSCTVEVSLPLDSPGLIRLLARWGERLAAYYVIAAGAWLDMDRGAIVMRGLDVLETVGNEPLLLTVDGATASIVPGGSTSYTVPLQAVAPLLGGDAKVSVAPMYRLDKIYGGEFVENEVAKLARLFAVDVPAGDAVIMPPFSAQLAGGEAPNTTTPVVDKQPFLADAGLLVLLLAAMLAAGRLTARRPA